MTEIDDKVFAETIAFEAALPDLVREHDGQWVVFRDGVARSFHCDFEAAHQAGLDAFGPHGGQVIGQVRPREPHDLSNAARRMFLHTMPKWSDDEATQFDETLKAQRR